MNHKTVPRIITSSDANPVLSLNNSSGTVHQSILTLGIGGTDKTTPLRVKAIDASGYYEPTLETPSALMISSTYSGTTNRFRLLPFAGDIYFQNSNESGSIYFTGNGGVNVAKTEFRTTITNFRNANSNTSTAFGSSYGMTLTNTDTTVGNYSDIMNYNSLSRVNSGIFFKNVDQVYAGAIHFTTRSTVSEYGVRMQITENGSVIINDDGLATADVRIEGDTDANLFFTDASVDKVGIGTNLPTIKLSVSEAGGVTLGGGYAVKLIAGEALNKGEVVYMNQAGTDLKVTKNPINGDMPLGIVYADAAQDAGVWIVTSGVAEVLPNAADTAARGYVIYSSTTTAGRVSQSATVPDITTHMRECGHFIASGSGAGVLTKAIIHFN